MKVICIRGANVGEIKKTAGPSGRAVTLSEAIFEGQIYNVCGSRMIEGEEWYFLSEKPRTSVYNSNRFIPCSEIDEKKYAEVESFKL